MLDIAQLFLQAWRLACRGLEIWRNMRRAACTPPSTAAIVNAAEINFAVIKRKIAGCCGAVVVCRCSCRCWKSYLSINICRVCCNAVEEVKQTVLCTNVCCSCCLSVTSVISTHSSSSQGNMVSDPSPFILTQSLNDV